jgi:protein TonB
MALKLNDSPELATTAKSGSAPVNPGSTPAQNPRSNPVCLEMPVTLRRLPGAEPSGASSLPQPAPEEARTVIVFENGAVLRVSSSIPAGTAVTLKNSRGQEVACRVASARNLPAIKGYVEVKFEEAANDFWGLQQGDRPAGVSAPATPAIIAAPPVANAPAITSGVPSPRPIAVPTPEKPQRNTPSFESNAGQALTSSPIGEARKLREPEPRLPAPGNAGGSARNVTQPPRVGASGNKANTIEFADEFGPISAPRSSANVSGHRPAPASTQDFPGAGQFVSAPVPTMSAASGAHRKMFVVLGGLAGGLVLASLGFFYVRRSNVEPQVPPPPPVSRLSAPAPPFPLGIDPVPPSAEPQDVAVVPASPAAPTAPAVPEQAVPGAVTSVPQVVRRSAEDADAKPPARPVAPRPTISDFKLSAPASARANASRLPDGSTPGAADLIASGPAPGAPLAGMLPSVTRSDNQPTPPPPAFGSLGSSTGISREAKQISITRPVYPEVAKAAHIGGVVVVEADVSEGGKVTGAKAVSGPTQLRQAAIEAVQQWKYQPALANGKPVATQVKVNIAFQLR